MRELDTILGELGLGDRDDDLASAASEVAAQSSREQTFLQVMGASLVLSGERVAEERARREDAEKQAANLRAATHFFLGAGIVGVLAYAMFVWSVDRRRR